MGGITLQKINRGSLFNRRIVITRREDATRVKMLEYVDELRMHGIEIVLNRDGSVHVSGFGYGFASPINMFQSSGSWHWGSFILNDEDINIGRDADCSDIAYLIWNVTYSLREPIISEFIKEFVKGYSMHGKKICAEIYFE
ncbi:MAG: hypothetical protein RMI45_05325 [Ignisphaera sp.]|nr:hypothetical protein [Ignisphaera sp.]MDW8085641.1 hypothetical protein [Ignisphaera sp.]